MILSKIKKEVINSRIKRIPEDVFIKRLRSLVIGEGMLHDGNIYSIDFAIKNMPKKGVVIEVGSYGGLSTSLILYLLNKNKREEKVINCDPWIYEGFNDADGNLAKTIDGRTDINRFDYSEYMKNAFINNMQFLNKENLPHSFQLSSNEFFVQYGNRQKLKDLFGRTIKIGEAVSFAYIDGNHAYDYVKKDFENIDKHLMESGFVLFDDSIDGSNFGSSLFMREMKENKSYQLVHRNPNYLFKKRTKSE